MASSLQYGYDDSRFENVVNPNFHCSICLNVLKEPKMCRHNQHVFCSSCITRHLANSSTCPECMDELTVSTLNQAPRVLRNCLSELKINCDFYDRGCRDFVQLGDLQTHINQCGFSPTTCSNQECGVEINKRDKIHHETEVCEFRKIKCHDCGKMRKDIEELNVNLTEMRMNQDEMKVNLTEMKVNQDEMKVNQDELKMNQDEMKVNLAEIKLNQDEMKLNKGELKVNLNEVKKHLEKVKRNLAEVKLNQAELKKHLSSLKEDIVREVGAMMGEVLRKSTAQYGATQASLPPLHVQSTTKQDIIIAGGYNGPRPSSSVEIFNWSERAWCRLPPMKQPRSAASCFVHNNQVIVAGGFTGLDTTDSMEMMKIDQKPSQWITFPAKLPANFSCHKSVVHQDRLIIIGGDNMTEWICPDDIYEVALAPPYSTKLLCRMPQPRVYHGAELINDKIFILGGSTTSLRKDVVDSVIMYDIVKKECKPMTSLPYAVWEMSTISWRNKVIVIGGEDKNGQILDNIVMYDVETGENERLPSMKYKRLGCSAVITANVIVVMGGWNKDQKDLKSVECFSFGSNSWQELPPMTECREHATAVVKPINSN